MNAFVAQAMFEVNHINHVKQEQWGNTTNGSCLNRNGMVCDSHELTLLLSTLKCADPASKTVCNADEYCAGAWHNADCARQLHIGEYWIHKPACAGMALGLPHVILVHSATSFLIQITLQGVTAKQ